MFIHPPDPALRQPLTPTAVLPLLSSFYVLGVLAILPNTFLLKLLLLPFIIWQAWKCAVELDLSACLVQLPGFQNADGLAFWNLIYVAAISVVALISIERTFTRRPLRRYELRNGLPIERPLSFSNVFVDSFDLLFNARGIGWSWSHTPFPRQGTRSPSITSILIKLLFKCTLVDASQYIIHIVCPSVKNPGGGSLFDPNLGPVRSTALAVFATIWGGLFVYATVDAPYQVAALIGQVVFRQPASHWPPFLRRPWMSTSIREFWSYRWHQALRHTFIVFGARPGGALLGRPGAIMGAFGVSAVIHHIGLWGLGKGMEFNTAGGFFLYMGLGVVMEEVFQKMTGLRVRGLLGWSWTMVWTAMWSTLMVDGWARHGMFVNHLVSDRLRLGKYLVDTVIALSGK